MSPEYIESVWWSLKRLHQDGLLYEAHRSVAYCPRCGTALSDHEVAMGYTTVVDPSVYVRFPLVDAPEPDLVGASIVAWTTTPWTLPSNLGLAVDPAESYAVVERNGERLIVATSLVERTLGEDARVGRTFDGERLVGARYTPPYPNVEGDVHRVVAGDFVGVDEGTGIVHIAPGFGAEDLDVGRREGWPVYRPIDDDGRFTDQTPVEFVRGRFVKDADPEIIGDLERRGVLLSSGDYEHTYPLCWRCDTPLLYMARTSWYIRTTAKQDRLLEVNRSVHWYPGHIKDGRMGNWLENNVDWALSRERYWGTPLPIWRCANHHATAIGSLSELSDLTGHDVTGVDPHRPAIDEVTIPCPECQEEARRVPEVIDTWYDSGAMPYAQWGYHPELGRGVDEFDRRFPADFISEGVDQTRGWFYSLMAEGTLLFDDTAYRTCVVLGLLLDAEGRKMSKRLGNVMEPFELMDRYGADALRWFFLAAGSPWTERRVSMEGIDEGVRRVLLTLWNVYSFLVTYANADRVDPSTLDVPLADRPPLDRWIRSRLAATTAAARSELDAYDATSAARALASFVDDLSNWYVRLARRRFRGAGGEPSPDAPAAHRTLYECLTTVARLMAPFTPFLADAIWRNLEGRTHGPESVHLADYPEAERAARDADLEAGMELARRVVELGRRVRTETRVPTRQPLQRAVVQATGAERALDRLRDLIAEELNVREVSVAEDTEGVASWRAKPNFRALGPRLGQRVKQVASAFDEDAGGRLAARLAAGEPVTLDLDGGPVEILPEEVELAEEARGGWGAASEGGVTVALDVEVSDELMKEGLAREIVRIVQGARKSAGLEVSDRIELGLAAEGALAQAIEEHRDWIAGEALAISMVDGLLDGSAHRQEGEVGGAPVTVTLRRAE
jgi:isoleucyl-tRNA synthetase